VTWRVHADPVMLVAGIRALLFQALHPLAMAGVAQFSDYRTAPWSRLHRTAEFVAKTTFGPADEAVALGARVRQLHGGMSGIDRETGRAYRVSDPELLRWVHVCEAESFLSTYRRAGGYLEPGEADRYYDEMQIAADLVGCPEVPRSEAAVEAYLRSMRPQLRATKDARAAARFIVNPPMPRWVALGTPAKPAWWAVGALAVSLLPRWARRMYALPGLPTTDLGATVSLRLLRRALYVVPPEVREGPALREARIRLSAIGPSGMTGPLLGV